MTTLAAASDVQTWTPPDGEVRSEDYELTVNQTPVFVYGARVREKIAKPEGSIWTHVMGSPAESAGMALFDFNDPVEIAIRPKRAFTSASVHPLSLGIKPVIHDGSIRFTLPKPKSVTIMLDGSDDKPLHLFCSPIETDIPKADDPNVIYFGPGVHDIQTLKVKTGQTVYIAGGAVVRANIGKDEKGTKSDRTGLVSYDGPTVLIDGVTNVRIRGRGILDGSLEPHASRAMLVVQNSSGVSIDGIVVRDSPNWNMTVSQSKHVKVENVKILSARLNSDGINSLGSTDVQINNCFVRNHDDGIAIKTVTPGQEASNISVTGCTIWSDWGYALGVTYETRADIHDISYTDCDVIFMRHWAMGVYVVDSATISRVKFENIHVEDAELGKRRFGDGQKLIRMAITSDMWGTDPKRGHIRDITFRNISNVGTKIAPSEIQGFGPENLIENVTFEGFHFNDKMISTPAEADMSVNEHVRNLRFLMKP